MKLPEPFASQALNNSGVQQFEPFIGNTIKEALMAAFSWNKSPEGGEYWENVAKNNLL